MNTTGIDLLVTRVLLEQLDELYEEIQCSTSETALQMKSGRIILILEILKEIIGRKLIGSETKGALVVKLVGLTRVGNQLNAYGKLPKELTGKLTSLLQFIAGDFSPDTTT